ncbi:N-acetylmuramoyl-L-alanine amidase [Mesorhizobium soli]|uniref:N-acetylmuramoyl-L-alanine amidase n=1 Tax=Pseudaminobacter soli (ex Li et al. 2025) TaxID=1295366 RepID=UPI0024750AEA|nr:N-acetylmuramoyl-L-alanine amidase [Mesorhizobium soli]MDH6232462.1 N-acetylmuramoyl-L-alanine amidase [Mesorhizobium soli]
MSGFSPDFAGAEVRVSPNFTQRRGTDKPDMVILHYTGMPTGAEAEAWLCDPASEVSSHYIVHEDGRIVQMVRESDRAWHAGKSSWRGVTDVNSWSVGIEVVNPGHILGYTAFPRCQIEAVIALCGNITVRHGIVPERILAHSDVSPGRKVDPGEKFPWRVLAKAGVGHFVEPARAKNGPVLRPGDQGAEVEKLQSMLSLYGYGIEITGSFDQETETVVAAFQRHFRPRQVDGVADPSTIETLRRLLSTLPRGAA